VIKLGEHMRLAPVMRGPDEGYVYEREVEEFLRWSPHVRRDREDGVAADREPLGF
jgi:UDP-glucose 4-epimerase